METLQQLAVRMERIAAFAEREASEGGEDVRLLSVIATAEGYALDFNAPVQARAEIKKTAREYGAELRIMTI